MWNFPTQMLASIVVGWLVMAIFLVRTERQRGLAILADRWVFVLVFGAAFGVGLASVALLALAFAIPATGAWEAQLGPLALPLAYLLTGLVFGALGAAIFRLAPIAEGPLSGARPSIVGWSALGALLGLVWFAADWALRQAIGLG